MEEAALLREKIRDFLNQQDRFCRTSNIQLTEIGEGFAKGELVITEESLNGLQAVQGGAVFTLGDFTAAGAALSYGNAAVTRTASITFLRPGRGKKLFAEAVECARGKQTGLYEVSIFDEDHRLIAKMSADIFVMPNQFLR